MPDLLLGDATATYTQPDALRVSLITYQAAWKFPALASGNVTELRFRTSDIANTGLTGLRLAIYADTGGAPTTLLGQGTFVGEPGTSTWITAGGLSVPVTLGEDYWLAVLPLGSNDVDHRIHYNTAVTSGGTPGVDAESGGGETTAPFLSPWTTFDPDNDDPLANGPIGFQAIGHSTSTMEFGTSGLEWHITGLWYPGETNVGYYGRVVDPVAGQVEIPLNNARTATVTLRTTDPAADSVPKFGTYKRCLRVYYHDALIFWGPIKLRERNAEDGTVTFSAVDPSLRLQRHQLRRGDIFGGLTEANDDKTGVPVDHTGLRLLRDAGLNTTEQTTRGVPDLGIDDGTNDYVATPFNLMGVSRGDQVWSQMIQLSQSLGPDFELEPVQTVGAYCVLNTYTRQGSNVAALIGWHYGTGRQNLADIRETEGTQYTTHAHVLPRDLSVRITQANSEASADTGPYVDWDATDYDSEGIDPDKVIEVLRAFGDDVLDAYSRPLQECILDIPTEDEGSYLYLRDYAVGDTVAVAARDLSFDLDSDYYRITTVRLSVDQDGAVKPEVQVIADHAAELADTIGTAPTGDD